MQRLLLYFRPHGGRRTDPLDAGRFAEGRQMQDIYRRARQIRLAIFDVDGVLTDGALFFSAAGEELKVFNVLDGHGMKLLQESGVALGVITSRSSPAVAARMRNLGID